MGLIESLNDFLWPAEGTAAREHPEGVCGNCWGHTEYDGKVRKIVADHQEDVKNGRDRHAFIQKFMVEHVSGIKLQNDGRQTRCPKCGEIHRQEDPPHQGETPKRGKPAKGHDTPS